jgi:putative FmdB family regulatory protein
MPLMPIFEYVCRDCAHEFETIVQGAATPECPDCHGANLQKRLSVFAVGAARQTAPARASMAGPCGSCGDPRGPGACSMN